jgi:hypothetical protein
VTHFLDCLPEAGSAPKQREDIKLSKIYGAKSLAAEAVTARYGRQTVELVYHPVVAKMVLPLAIASWTWTIKHSQRPDDQVKKHQNYFSQKPAAHRQIYRQGSLNRRGAEHYQKLNQKFEIEKMQYILVPAASACRNEGMYRDKIKFRNQC